ncbi:MAG: 2-oxoacid:acceptor oxidoreductase family protein [Acidimicrobiia bacterium]
MERELLMSGIGGRSAARDHGGGEGSRGRQVQLFGSYGGMMRGGSTRTNLRARRRLHRRAAHGGARGRRSSCTTSTRAHPLKLRARSIVFVNSSVYEETGAAALDNDTWTVVDVPAMDLAVDLGNVLVGSMVITGAYARYTGLVPIDALTAAVADALPPYRVKHIELNQTALRAGWDHMGAQHVDAWSSASSQEATV